MSNEITITTLPNEMIDTIFSFGSVVIVVESYKIPYH